MMRIDLLSHTPEEVVLRVSGEVAGPEVGVLEAEGERWLAQGCRVVLELRESQAVTLEGLLLLYRWSRQPVPVELRHLDPFLWGFAELFFPPWAQEQQILDRAADRSLPADLGRSGPM